MKYDIFHYKDLQKYPNWDFWFENKPSGNPAQDAALPLFVQINT
jgi:hypothetical protein